MKTPTWGEIAAFLRADGGWRPTRQTKHTFYEKVLNDGRVLNTHVSFAEDKTMHPDTFRDILRLQLRVTAAEFWETIAQSRSVRAEVAQPSQVKRLTLAITMELKRKLHVDDAELAEVTFEEAKRRLDEFHSRTRT